MIPEKIEGAHVELGREQGFVPLYIRYEVTADTGTGKRYPSIVAQFMPTAEEKRAIARGEPIVLRILGIDWPPVSITVGDEFDKQIADDGLRYVAAVHRDREIERLKHVPRPTPVAGEPESQ